MNVAKDMTTGVCCECCGEYLLCDECEEIGIPAYCSDGCAEDRGAKKEQVCDHGREME
jgi:hypothetical protein